MSELVVRLPHRTYKIPAYSGARPSSNQRAYMCLPDVGAVPVGQYYIIDRKAGGRLGWLREQINKRKNWFALYRIDDIVDDEMLCDGYKRGNFRIHFSASYDGSRGCITLINSGDFENFSADLKGIARTSVPRLGIEVYGILTVV